MAPEDRHMVQFPLRFHPAGFTQAAHTDGGQCLWRSLSPEVTNRVLERDFRKLSTGRLPEWVGERTKPIGISPLPVSMLMAGSTIRVQGSCACKSVKGALFWWTTQPLRLLLRKTAFFLCQVLLHSAQPEDLYTSGAWSSALLGDHDPWPLPPS